MDIRAGDHAPVPAAPLEMPTTSSIPSHPLGQPEKANDDPFPRQKRKRTSAEDAAILEAAYLRDPKPDKTARLELVSKVALGEKEVQIWFQNRRQTDRRRSRPLLPHEIAQYHMSRAAAPTNAGELHSEPEDHVANAVSASQGSSQERPASEEGHGPDQERHLKAEHTPPSVPGIAALSRPPPPHPLLHLSSSLGRKPTSAVSYFTGPRDPSNTVAYLANRRSAPSLRHSSSEQPMLPPPIAMSVPSSDRRLRKSSSFVRLSMSAEGKAEVITKDASSPSPPRPHQVLLPEVMGSLAQVPTLPAPRNLQRSSSGRSRDSRAWEFWCDKEARTELGNAAEKDANGSAAGAIGLLRTAAGRNILGAIPAKRNSALSGQPSSAKRPRLGQKRGAIQRSSTSMGRLQGSLPSAEQGFTSLKHSESAKSFYAKGSDSDKENWSPDPQQSVAGDLQVQRNGQPRTEIPENDEEVAAFMRGGKPRRSVSGTEDLDCVQGLLSLSQGNWR